MPLWFVRPLGNFVGIRILNRAWAELKNADFTLAIVLSAMAVECELTRLFMKQNEVDLMNTRTPTPADKDKWEEQWRKWNTIATRLAKVSTLLTGENFDSFLSHNPRLLNPIYAKYPAFTGVHITKDFFIKEFFHKRNRILHSGEINFEQPEGEMCFTLAATLFQVMKEMDDQSIKALDAKHAAQRAATSKPTV